MPNNKQFFHVSRFGEIPHEVQLDTQYLLITLPEDAPKSDHEILSALKQYFPVGFSHFGRGYLTEPFKYFPQVSGFYNGHMYAIELVFELIRRLHYPTLPSRYTSFFGFEKIEDAMNFRGQNDCPIYKVESDTYFKADMKLLLLGKSSIHALSFANRYWNGETSDNPIWEFLLTHPIRVIEKVC